MLEIKICLIIATPLDISRGWNYNEPSVTEPPACGSININGRLIASKCSGSDRRFICERYLGAPPRCQTGWQPYGDFCYKVMDI